MKIFCLSLYICLHINNLKVYNILKLLVRENDARQIDAEGFNKNQCFKHVFNYQLYSFVLIENINKGFENFKIFRRITF